jgi:uncharacterized protein (TIGR03083 family)
MTAMDAQAALVAENAAFATLVADADPDTPVAGCPGWTLQDLMLHLGRGERWCARIVADAAREPVDPRGFDAQRPGPEGPAVWLTEGVGSLLSAVAATGPQTPVWTFVGPRPAQWWIRRRLHETLVHRADAALALGTGFDVDPEVAADAVSEYLDLVAGRVNAGGDLPLADGQTLHLHATDVPAGGEWTVFGRPDGIAVTGEHAKSTVAVRGPAGDLLLALARRGIAGERGLEVFGEPVIWQTWLARTPL